MNNIKNDGLSIILPVFNEKDIIEQVARDTYQRAVKFAGDMEIIAVNDGSTDRTLEALNRLNGIIPQFRIISHPNNKGYGAALTAGIKAAEKSWVLLMDSDGQMKIDSLQAAWECKDEFDLQLGYREKRADGFYRRILGMTGNLIANMLLGYHVKDINCGFKLFRKGIIQPLPLTSTGGAINFEILYLIFKNNPSIKWQQFPVTHYPRKSGKSTGSDPKVIKRIVTEAIRILGGPLSQKH